jgi:hypothetical protein
MTRPELLIFCALLQVRYAFWLTGKRKAAHNSKRTTLRTHRNQPEVF